jgi:hypothetical protein
MITWSPVMEATGLLWQDLGGLLDPNTVTAGTYPVGQIFFDAFAARYKDSSKAGPLFLLIFIG